MTTNEVLKQCIVDGNIVYLPDVQLDRKEYLEVAKALNLIGGKWKGGKVGGFVFKADPTKLLEQIAGGESRNIKKEYQFFGTPQQLASKMVYLADIQPHDTVLEPSAGQGAIIKEINNVSNVCVDCYELLDTNRMILDESDLNFNLIADDFLEHSKRHGMTYTKIIANPPFTKNQDVDHFMKMWDCLAYGGMVVCITSTSWSRGSQKKQIAFQEFIYDIGAEVTLLSAGTFRESGTMVEANLITATKKQ